MGKKRRQVEAAAPDVVTLEIALTLIGPYFQKKIPAEFFSNRFRVKVYLNEV